MDSLTAAGQHYAVGSFSERRGVLAPMVDLFRLCFQHYEGALNISPDYLEWFSGRPGFDWQASQIALAGDDLAASLFITTAQMVVAGQVRPVAITDSVMTHPDCRRRGLARALMLRSLESVKGRAEANILFTQPGTPPHEFYLSLGFRDWFLIHVWERAPGPASGPQLRALDKVAHQQHVSAALTSFWGDHEGWLPLDKALWRWRKQQRPACAPSTVYALEADAPSVVTVASAEVIREGSIVPRQMLTDWAGSPDSLPRLLAGAAALRPDCPTRALTAATDGPSAAALTKAGFQDVATEVAMLLSLAPPTERAAPTRLPAYVPVESVVGV